jgi:2'-5' RNA ligase
MPRWRLGVALLVPEPARAEVDGLRRALGDPALSRIPAHLTLVPPVNVREDDIPAALEILRAAAAGQAGPLRLTLGPAESFMPHNPVVFLGVGGDLDALHALRMRVFTPPLERSLTWSFVPHVTVCDTTTPERIAAALTALADFAVDVRIDRVHLLREGEGRVWQPIADAPFSPAAVVGRGGLEVQLSVTDRLDPEAAAFAAAEWDSAPVPLAITARRQGEVIGVAEGRVSGEHAHLSNLIVGVDARTMGVGAHMVNAFLAAAQARGARHVTVRTRTEGFYRRLGWEEEARLSDGFVQFVRHLPDLT